MSRLVTGSEPYLFPAGRTGCILTHGFTSMPEETLLLGKFLAENGITALGVRLAGHGSTPQDLRHTQWTDWLLDLETAYSLLANLTDRILFIGQSMGGILSLISSTELPVAGVVTLATPASPIPPRIPFGFYFQRVFFPTMYKGAGKDRQSPGARREPDYPAYPSYPSKIHFEVHKLQLQLRKSLPLVSAPALIIQSKDDPWVPESNAEFIYSQIKSLQKSIFWLEKAGHSILLSDDRGLAFHAILNFIQELPPV